MIYEVSQMTKEIIHYSEEELKRLSNQELANLVYGLNTPNKGLFKFIKSRNMYLINEITCRTSFLDENITFLARLYCLDHNIIEHPICNRPDCTNKVKWHRGVNAFAKYCCLSCCPNDEKYWEGVRLTNNMIFGCDYPLQNPNIRQKTVDTTIEHFGVNCILKLQDIQEKIKATNKTKYGFEYASQSDKVQDIMRHTCFEHLGVYYPGQSEEVKSKMRETNLAIRGVDNPWKDPNVIAKIGKTTFEHYGVKHYAQSFEYHKNRKHKFESKKYPGNRFDSTWEVKVYEFCRNNNIPIEYSPKISYPYEYDGRRWTYHPDFLINGKVYEVKGDNFFKIDESTNKEIMINPYRKPEWTDEIYDWECRKYEAKHQCMLANNVVILRGKDIENLNIEMFNQ